MNVLNTPLHIPSRIRPYAYGTLHAALIVLSIGVGMPLIGAGIGAAMLVSIAYSPAWMIQVVLWGIYGIAVVSASLLLRSAFRSLTARTPAIVTTTALCALVCTYVCYLSFSEMRAGITPFDAVGTLMALSWLLLPFAHFAITRRLTR